MRIIISLIAGGIFGAGIHISGMSDKQMMIGFLDLFGSWDPTLAFVWAGTLLPMTIAWRFVPGRQPLTGGSFSQKQTEDFDYKLIIGAILFGIGWGLSGFVPGAAFASLSYGGSASVIFVISMLVGMRITPLLQGLLDSFKTTE